MQDTQVFEAVGGEAAFFELVEQFYVCVQQDAALRALYPEDLEPGKRALALFLAQRFGGPGTYSQERGHPRLRMRHAPYAIDASMRDAWMRCMRTAVQAVPALAAVEPTMLAYFEDAATHMINR